MKFEENVPFYDFDINYILLAKAKKLQIFMSQEVSVNCLNQSNNSFL